VVSPGGWLEFCFVMRHFSSSDLSDYGTEPGLGGFWGVLLAASVGRTLSPSASVVVLLMSDFLAYYYQPLSGAGLHFFANAQRNEAKKRVSNREYLSVVVAQFRLLART
jgi:hypothetical protein